MSAGSPTGNELVLRLSTEEALTLVRILRTAPRAEQPAAVALVQKMLAVAMCVPGAR